ncbi:hypothetical protein HJFPF1_03720 [Paramyrothecium foliicola]|nr:hypothetical protein HJFPF1_03720 [Paramyrothecium foliicola]
MSMRFCVKLPTTNPSSDFQPSFLYLSLSQLFNMKFTSIGLWLGAIASAAAFQITIKNPTGFNAPYDVQADLTVAALKSQIESRGGPPAAIIELRYEGDLLVNSKTLGEYEIGEGATLESSIMPK